MNASQNMTQAIFLSYASQAADFAKRLCEAMRAVGLEVWFDQSELRGGDAWDASIRKQIIAVLGFANRSASVDDEYFRRRFAEGGWQGFLKAMVSQSSDRVPRIQIAYAQVELGRKSGKFDDAFATLDAIVENYDQFTLWLNSGVRLESIRNDPRFAVQLKPAGF